MLTLSPSEGKTSPYFYYRPKLPKDKFFLKKILLFLANSIQFSQGLSIKGLIIIIFSLRANRLSQGNAQEAIFAKVGVFGSEAVKRQ